MISGTTARRKLRTLQRIQKRPGKWPLSLQGMTAGTPCLVDTDTEWMGAWAARFVKGGHTHEQRSGGGGPYSDGRAPERIPLELVLGT